MKTADLEGEQLDYWVAVAFFGDNIEDPMKFPGSTKKWPEYKPSVNWEEGGPIIEREKISVIINSEDEWAAQMDDYNNGDFYAGGTPLIAAMRCLVASKFGDEV